MQPRQSTGLPGNFSAGVRLKLSLVARVILSVLAGVLLATSSTAASNVIQYGFDPAGNITNVTRQSTGAFAITSFTPSSGALGTAVEIYGAGFSTTPANNTVKFNGVTATVTASDAGSIATTVPTAATTGRITVTVAGNTATSATDFVVTIAGAPTIASFTPGTGASATTVSLTGTNFNATSGATTFALNGVSASGSASSTTAGTITVPGAASSGRISATTSVGTGTSSNDFIVPPAGLSAGDIETTRRIVAGAGNVQVTVGTANRSALVLFDGTANGWYSLQFRALDVSPSSSSVTYKVIKPDNSTLSSGSLSMSGDQSLHLPKLPTSGTYTLQLSPGIATLNTLVRLESNPVLALDGADAAIAQDYANQTSRFVFNVTAGQRVGFGVKNLGLWPSGSSVTFYQTQPDGSGGGQFTCLTPISANTAGNCGATIQASSTGTYQIITSRGVQTSGLVQVSSPAAGTLVKDVTQAVSLTRVGQPAEFGFAAAAGDSVGIDLSGAIQSPQASSITLQVYRPNGSFFSSCGALPPANLYCDIGSIATAGTYTIVASPQYGTYGTFNLTAKSGPLVVAGGSSSSFASTVASESVRARFVASAGETVSVGMSGLTYDVSGGTTYLKVYSPSGSELGTASCNAGNNCKLTLVNLAAGTYAISAQPPGGVKISGALLVSNDVTGTLTAGTPETITVGRIGQRAAYTFSGAAGDNIALEMFGVTTTPSGQSLTATVYKPDGSYYNYMGASPAGYMNIASLPSTGTWKVVLEAGNGATWQGQLLLDAGTTTTIDASTIALSAANAGQPIRYKFSGTSGQRLNFGVSGLGYASASSNTTTYRIIKPDGSDYSGSCTPSTVGSCDFEIASLPATGTYVVMLIPPAASQISGGTLALSTPSSGTFVIGDPAQTVSITRPGQTARYTFSGTAAQTLRLNWTSVSTTGTGNVSVSVLNPSGGTVSSSTFANGASGGFDIAALPSTGTYTVVLDPPVGNTLSGSFSLVTR